MGINSLLENIYYYIQSSRSYINIKVKSSPKKVKSSTGKVKSSTFIKK